MFGFFKKKQQEEEVNACEFSEVMENAMGVQGKAMVNQVELNVAYQAYAMFRLHYLEKHADALSDAARVVIGLEKEIEKTKLNYDE